MYKIANQKVTITEGKAQELTVAMQPNFAMVTLTSVQNATVYVDDVERGVTRWSGKLVTGPHTAEAILKGHRKKTIALDVIAGQDQTVALEPEPMYGSLDISANVDATVSIDGKKHPDLAPIIIEKLLVGEHEVTLSANGYKSFSKKIEVAEGKIAVITATMEEGTSTQPATGTPATSGSSGGFEMVFVQGGTFTMGCTSEQSDCYDWEKPAHKVTVSSFNIGKYEVTQAQWVAIMGNNPSAFKGDNLPVETVSWNDVQEFIRRLNTKTGKQYRLPTEAEWEYAAHGGNKSSGYKYSGGNNIGNVAWYGDNSGSTTHAVGTKQANELGIYDMSGNVWEWCSDWYDAYSSASQTNPTGTSSGSARVNRGGGWYNRASGCRVSARSSNSPGSSYIGLGFRLVVP
jgi:formylglycine-generating enzyme required for sulfatase activity